MSKLRAIPLILGLIVIGGLFCGPYKAFSQEKVKDKSMFKKMIRLFPPLVPVDTVNVYVIGDVMLHKSQMDKEYGPFLEDLSRYACSADVSVANMEFPLGGKPYTGYPSFSAPTDYADYVASMGFDVFLAANNHIMDFRAQGAENTCKALEGNGVSWFWNETYYVFEHEGIRVAFFGLEHSKYYSLANWLTRTFRELKDSGGVSAIVVYVHTGIEYKGEHENKAAAMAQDLVGMGADLVLLSHPHVLQGMDIIDNRTVFYSMGNFVFGGNSAIRYEKYHVVKEVSSLYSMAVQVKMSFTNEGQYLGQRVVIYPAYISDDPNVNHYQPRRVNAQEAKPVRDAIQRDTAFNLPELKEEDGFAVMEFPYLAATDDVMLPEDDED